tara:strand:- start:969 stop:1625 length:657 start_codon:yes stop_codon:yes gene_type:complete
MGKVNYIAPAVGQVSDVSDLNTPLNALAASQVDSSNIREEGIDGSVLQAAPVAALAARIEHTTPRQNISSAGWSTIPYGPPSGFVTSDILLESAEALVVRATVHLNSTVGANPHGIPTGSLFQIRLAYELNGGGVVVGINETMRLVGGAMTGYASSEVFGHHGSVSTMIALPNNSSGIVLSAGDSLKFYLQYRTVGQINPQHTLLYVMKYKRSQLLVV